MKKESLSLAMSKLILVVSFIVGIGAVLGVLGYVLTKQKCAVQSPPVAQKADEIADWKTYRNEEYGFEFKYPNSWIELTTEDDKTRGNTGYTNRFITIKTDNKEIVGALVFDGKADKSNDKDWAANIDIGNNKHALITYVQCSGPGCLGGQKDIKIFKQILSTFKFIK